MKPLAIDKYGIVRHSNGQRRGNDTKGFDVKQLEVEPEVTSQERVRLRLLEIATARANARRGR